MKKILLVVAALLIIAAASAPFVNGLVMEKMVTRSQDNINQLYADSGSGLAIEIIDYDRGYAASEITWKVRFGSLSTIYGTEEVLFVDRARHGLFGVVSTTSLEKNPWYEDLLNNRLGGTNPLTISTRYDLTGKIESLITLSSFSFKADNETLEILPGRIVTKGDAGLTRLTSEATWDGLIVSNQARIEGFSMSYDLEKMTPYIWDGFITYALRNISIQEESEIFELSDFKGEFSLNFDRDADKLSTGGTMEISSLVNEKEDIRDIFVRLDFNNIDARGYEECMRLYTRTVNSMLDSVSEAEGDPEMMDTVINERMASVGFQMMGAYEKLLKKGLEVKISDLRASLASGNVTGRLQFSLNQDVTFAQLATVALQPNMAFQILSLESNLRFPAELAGNNPMLTSPVYQGMQTGLFEPDKDYLVHSAHIRDGRLFLNGREVIL